MAINDQSLISAAISGGLITQAQVASLRSEARRSRKNLIELITHHGRFPRATLYRALAEERKMQFFPAGKIKPDIDLIRRLPDSLLSRKGVIPTSTDEGAVIIISSDPDDRGTINTIARLIGEPPELALAEPDAIAQAIRDLANEGLRAAPIRTTATSEFDPVEELNRLFIQAWLLRASDIHIEPAAGGPRIRLRVDGQLQPYPVEMQETDVTSLVSRVKVLADLDIAEQREPQDGGLTFPLPEPATGEIDVRIATVPTRWGERMTIRLLGQETQGLTLDSIGMKSTSLNQFSKAITQPHGLILLTGPTGSGKTTTLYAALRSISRPEINIMTVEDPVEYLLDEISQVQVTSKVTFAGALRSFLRHDPDVLMVGEIRDAETADIALKAAMTGHLVFSTLHTNDSPSAVTRLVDIGAERFLLSASLLGIIAQRLVRRLCEKCVGAGPLSPDDREWLAVDDEVQEVPIPVGCPVCLGTGYRGRIGLYEALWIDKHVSNLIHEGASERELAEQATDFETLYQDARNKVLTGVTSISEVRRIVPSKGEVD